MLILFGSHYGKNISVLDSSYLIWIIEKCDSADWTLIQECKKELAERLKLDWSPKSDIQLEIETALRISTRQVDNLLKENKRLLDTIMMSVQCKGNHYKVEGYLHNPKYMYSIMEQIKSTNNPTTAK